MNKEKALFQATFLIRTCAGFPSQWEGVLDNDRSFYIRYRHGHFYLQISKFESNNVDDALDGIYLIDYDDGTNGGIMSDEEMFEAVKYVISFDNLNSNE